MSQTEGTAKLRPQDGRCLAWLRNSKEARLSEVKRARRRVEEDRHRVEGTITEATIRTFTLSDLESYCCFFKRAY